MVARLVIISALRCGREFHICSAPKHLVRNLNPWSIWQALPFSGEVKTWGEEIYFGVPLEIDLEAGQEVVGLGDLGYWPPRNAFCIFFGPTPVSSPGEIRAASAVDIFGKLVDDPTVFKGVKEGEQILVERA